MEENPCMSLLQEAMEKCVMLDKITTPDGYGGRIDTWQDGAEFLAAIVLDSSIQARRGQQEGVTAVYTVTTKKNMNLQFHEVFRRLSDGKIFRVKSDGDDLRTPNSATLNMRNVSAEEFVLPS